MTVMAGRVTNGDSAPAHKMGVSVPRLLWERLERALDAGLAPSRSAAVAEALGDWLEKVESSRIQASAGLLSDADHGEEDYRLLRGSVAG